MEELERGQILRRASVANIPESVFEKAVCVSFLHNTYIPILRRLQGVSIIAGVNWDSVTVTSTQVVNHNIPTIIIINRARKKVKTKSESKQLQ